jgi:hypothetical protein
VQRKPAQEPVLQERQVRALALLAQQVRALVLRGELALEPASQQRLEQGVVLSKPQAQKLVLPEQCVAVLPERVRLPLKQIARPADLLTHSGSNPELEPATILNNSWRVAVL